jgi:hypothetical protein
MTLDWSKLGHIATKGSQGKLFKCRTVWPLWYTSFNLTEEELTIVEHDLIYKEITPIKIKDILNIQIAMAGPFASIKVYYKYVTGDHKNINWLRRGDAIKLRRLVHGLMSEQSNNDESGGQ